MASMFRESQFNQPIGNWSTSRVTSMHSMFYVSDFNQPLGMWNVTNVYSLSRMFCNSKFNQDLKNWDIRPASIMYKMFEGAQDFEQSREWDITRAQEESTGLYRTKNGNWKAWSAQCSEGYFPNSMPNKRCTKKFGDVRCIQGFKANKKRKQCESCSSYWCPWNSLPKPDIDCIKKVSHCRCVEGYKMDKELERCAKVY